MVIVEKNFPRGGTVVSKSTNESKPIDGTIFGTAIKKTKKRASTVDKSSNEIDDEVTKSQPNFISYDTVQEDMLIMGVIYKIDALGITITLPGRMSAKVSALEISDAYCKMTSQFIQNATDSKYFRPLTDIFHNGQIIYGRVKEINESKTNKKHINMTLKPNEIHRDLLHTNIKKGFLFQGSIEEIQEHGYIIENGIQGLRSFLPKSKALNEEYAVGQLIFLKVDSVKSDTTATTIICKEMKEDNLYLKAHSDPNVDYIMPSTIVQYNISSILKDSVEGTIMNESLQAFANEHHLKDSLTLLEDYEINSVHKARILYTMPLTKQVYLTLNIEKNYMNDGTIRKYERGDIVENARVNHLGTGGIILILDNELKGMISYKSVKAPFKGNYDHDDIVKKYFKKSKHTVRILGYDVMESLYLCTDDPTIVNEKYFVIEDVKPGDFVTGIVEPSDKNTNYCIIKIGKLKGFLEKLHMTGGKIHENTKIHARVLSTNKERSILYLTNRSEYMQKDAKILIDLNDAKPNKVFMGTVVKIQNAFVLVKFFNGIQGCLYTNTSPQSNASSFYEGQTTLFRIAEVKQTKLTLTLPEDNFKIGEICPTTVKHILDSGAEIEIASNENDEKYTGFIPINYLSDYGDIQIAKLKALNQGMTLSAVCIGKNIFSIRDVEFFQYSTKNNWSNIRTGDILKAFVKNVNEDLIEIVILLNNSEQLVKVHWKMFIQNAFHNANITFSVNQTVFVKVLSKEPSTKSLAVSAKLMDVWDGDLTCTAEYIKKYIHEVENIKKSLQRKDKLIAKFEIGDKINAKFEEIDNETKDWIYSFENSYLVGIVRESFTRKMPAPEKGAEQECVILWINYSQNIVYISNKNCDIAHIKRGFNLSNNLKKSSGVTAKVLLKLDTVLVCSLKKGCNPIVLCPMRLHYNDFENSIGINLKEGEFHKIAFIHDAMPIAIPVNTWKLWKDKNRKRPATVNDEIPPKKKAKPLSSGNTENKQDICTHSKTKIIKSKILEDDTDMSLIETSHNTNDISDEKSITNKKSVELGFFEDKCSYETSSKKYKDKIISKRQLPGVTEFWESTLNKDDELNSDSSSEDEGQALDNNNPFNSQKRKKLTSAEKFKQSREEESRLREIEEKFADPNQLPETVEQYERLVISDPNNSKNWINFMVYYLQSAEVEKARALAKRALKTISIKNTDNLLNMWAALLNLELRYGKKENFDEHFKEALACNDPLRVYLRVIDIYIGAKKFDELNELLNNFLKKFKKEADAWKAAADAYLQMNMPDKAQQMLHRALVSLPEREHVNTIVAFANIHNKYGNKEISHTLFDQVVTSYPKRVDVWNQYTDTLIKDNLIDQARSVLERALNQKIPLKKVRTIFKKLLEVEQRYGTDADVERVKNMAAEYVKKNSI